MTLYILGRLKETDSEHTGTIQIPNLSDENTADDLDVCFWSHFDLCEEYYSTSALSISFSLC